MNNNKNCTIILYVCAQQQFYEDTQKAFDDMRAKFLFLHDFIFL